MVVTQVDLVVREKCVTIHKTICTQVQQSVSLPACNIKYVPELVLTEATVLEVIMVKQCITQLVMVCTVQEDGVDDGKGWNECLIFHSSCSVYRQLSAISYQLSAISYQHLF